MARLSLSEQQQSSLSVALSLFRELLCIGGRGLGAGGINVRGVGVGRFTFYRYGSSYIC